MYQNQTQDDKYVVLSRLFQETDKFSCVLLYIWIRKKSNSMQSGHHQFCIFFPNFCLALDENASCFESFNPHAKQTYIRADRSASLHILHLFLTSCEHVIERRVCAC